MRRREFIAGVGSTAVWPLTARAQQGERVRRIGILEVGDEVDRVNQARWGATREVLARLGWIEGRNARFEIRFSANDPDRVRAHADELVRLVPDVIAVASGAATQVLLQRTRTIPIVFTNVGDPVAMGLLKNIARPEGNATGITSLFQSFGGKWLELLKEAAPRTARVALVFAAGIVADQYFEVIDKGAEALAVKIIRMPYRNAVELERAIDNFAVEPDGGLFILPPPPIPSNRDLINRLAVTYRLPAIYFDKHFAAEGGLISYGSDTVELNRIAAIYVDRILRGAKPGDLPVQFPTKFEMTVNLKTAKALGLSVPQSILLRADEVIE
jgi:putative tryptophan/tyrosine transport system substrate-binding protein